MQSLPYELVDFILSETGEHQAIASAACKLFRHSVIKRKCSRLSVTSLVNLKLVSWALTNGCFLDPRILVVAIRTGDIPFIREVLELGIPMDSKVLLYGMTADNFQTIRWLLTNEYFSDPLNPGRATALTIEPSCLERAAAISLELVQFLFPFVKVTSQVAVIAATMGKVDILDFLEEKEVPLDENYTSAARSDNMEVVHWLQDREIPITDTPFVTGDLSIVKFCIENGYIELDHDYPSLYDEAPADSIIPIREYLLECGIDFDRDEMGWAIGAYSLPVTEWLTSQGAEIPEVIEGISPPKNQKQIDNMEKVLKWYQDHGCEFYDLCINLVCRDDRVEPDPSYVDDRGDLPGWDLQRHPREELSQEQIIQALKIIRKLGIVWDRDEMVKECHKSDYSDVIFYLYQV